jgi:cytochrome c oxidase cbb3-type subunit IV
MIQNVLRTIGGVGGYGVISVCLFFAAFLGVVIWVWRLKRSYLDSMRDLPLEDDPDPAEPARTPSNPQARHE